MSSLGTTLAVGLVTLGLILAAWWAWTSRSREAASTGDEECPSSEAPREADLERFAQVQDAFEDLIAVDPARRRAELERMVSDPDVRREVLEMVQAHESGGLLDELAASLDAYARPARTFPDAGRSVGHYTLREKLGSGGMGVVYRAEDERLERMVALKFLSPSLSEDPTAKERFLAEARAAAALDHPNICRILEVGEVEGQLFIAMPYYQGRTVKDLLTGGPLGEALAVPIAIQVARGLASAHASGVIHRDVKPANVIVTEGGDVTIVDFGVAKVARRNLTRTGVALGTVSYMSPEQTLGDTVDHRTDIWALGVMLYEMVAGVRPFRGATDQAVKAAILTAPHEPLSPHLDRAVGLEEVVDRALAKEAGDRYATVAEMVDALEHVRMGSAPAGGDRSARGGVMRKGERRQVTVLVTRLSNFDDLVDQLSPDAVETVLKQVRRVLSDAVSVAGGMVHAVHADRIESVFGLPEAHEDDVRRAVHAALEAERRCEGMSLPSDSGGAGIRLRSGIDVGVVGVHLDPDDEGKYRFGRSLMERAGRLADEAQDGAVLVTSDSHRLVQPFVDADHGPDVALGQDSGTIPTYRIGRIRDVQSSIEARVSGGLTAFTGRRAEVDILQEDLARALDGAGGVVTISGEAGIGKSRLLYEFEQGLTSDGVRALYGRCQSYGAGVPYLPFLDLLRQLLDIGERDSPTGDEIVERVGALGGELLSYAPFYQHLLSVPSHTPLPQSLTGDQLRLAIVESLAALFTVASGSRPLALLLEDWHWADEASTSALLHFGELITSFPVLVVVSYRPGYGVTWESLPNHRHVSLKPLVADHAHDIIASTLRVEAVDAGLAARIHDRAQGNPFFIEEMCAALLEEGAIEVQSGRAEISPQAQTLSLPDSVQAVIRTRLDRMTPATREVLSAASVVGRDFTRELVSRALPGVPDLKGALERLRVGGLIRQTRLVPEATYRFKHALIQEVTYETLLGHRRKELHRRVGEAMEELDPSSEEDRPFARLGTHFLRAEVWGKAVHYALGAARRASDLSQIPDALRALEVAETALAQLGEEEARRPRLELLLMKERLLETAGERSEQRSIIAELRPLVEECGDVALEAEILIRAGDLEVSLRNYEAAEEALLAAVDRARGAADSSVHRKALRSLGLLRWHQDRNEDALEILQSVLEDDRAAGDTEGMIVDHHNLGSVLRSMGRIEQALEFARKSRRLAEHSPFREVYAIHTAALCLRELGRTDDAVRIWQEGIELCERHHLPLQQSYLMTSLAHLYLQAGRTEDCLELYREAVELTRRVRHAEGIARAVSALAKVLEGLGRTDEALPHWIEASAWFERMQEYDRQAIAQSRIATILEARGEAQKAMASWGNAHQLAGDAGDEELEIESLMNLARLTREHLGAVRLATPYYESALQIAHRSGRRTREGTIRNALGVIAWESGDYEAARRHYAAGVDCFEGTDHVAALGHTLSSLGQTLRSLHRLEDAREILERAIRLHREAGNRRLEGYALAALGDTLLEQGELTPAYRAFQDSLEIREQIGDRVGAGWMCERLARTAYRMGHLDRVRELIADATLIAAEVGAEDLEDACAKLRP